MYSKGISWIDDCRIPYIDDTDKQNAGTHGRTENAGKKTQQYGQLRNGIETELQNNRNGRFPANILVSDDMLNDGNISKGGRMINLSNPYDFYEGTQKTYTIQCAQQIDDKGTNSRYYDIDKWFEKLLND